MADQRIDGLARREGVVRRFELHMRVELQEMRGEDVVGGELKRPQLHPLHAFELRTKDRLEGCLPPRLSGGNHDMTRCGFPGGHSPRKISLPRIRGVMALEALLEIAYASVVGCGAFGSAGAPHIQVLRSLSEEINAICLRRPGPAKGRMTARWGVEQIP